MARLKLVVGALALLAATPAAADPVARWHMLIEAASARCGVPAAWIAEVMRAESGGRTEFNGRPIVSRAGAMGLMQLMPGTWAEMRSALGLGSDPHAPRDNILAGACYLRRLHDRFGHPGLFAAYNAGPARYAAHLVTGRPLPAETRAYLTSVAGPAAPYKARGRTPFSIEEQPGLFFVLRQASMMGVDPGPDSDPQPGNSPFVALRRAAGSAHPNQ